MQKPSARFYLWPLTTPQTHTNYLWLQVPYSWAPRCMHLALHICMPQGETSIRRHLHWPYPPSPLSAASGLDSHFSRVTKCCPVPSFPGDTGTVGISGPQSGGKLQGKGALGSSLALPHTALCAGLSSWSPHPKPSSLCPPVGLGYVRQLRVGSSSSSAHPQRHCDHPTEEEMQGWPETKGRNSRTKPHLQSPQTEDLGGLLTSQCSVSPATRA